MGSLERARNFVGWPSLQDVCWPYQVKVLKEQGLKPEHVLLEIGAGCLGVGHVLIEYLEPGHYWALEPNSWLVDASRIPKDRFHLFTFDDFELTRIRQEFDYVFAHSVFTHADRDQVRTCLMHAHRVLRRGGRLIASFYDQNSGDSDHEGWMYPNGCTYTAGFIEGLAQAAGFEVRTDADVRHPIHHTWLFGRKE